MCLSAGRAYTLLYIYSLDRVRWGQNDGLRSANNLKNSKCVWSTSSVAKRSDCQTCCHLFLCVYLEHATTKRVLLLTYFVPAERRLPLCSGSSNIRISCVVSTLRPLTHNTRIDVLHICTVCGTSVGSISPTRFFTLRHCYLFLWGSSGLVRNVANICTSTWNKRR